MAGVRETNSDDNLLSIECRATAGIGVPYTTHAPLGLIVYRSFPLDDLNLLRQIYHLCAILYGLQGSSCCRVRPVPVQSASSSTCYLGWDFPYMSILHSISQRQTCEELDDPDDNISVDDLSVDGLS